MRFAYPPYELLMGSSVQLPQTDRQALLLIAGYFLLHFLIRIAEPNGLELDEGAELVRTQALQLGYGTQPPLYTWLLWPFMTVFGPGVWPLALVKNLLLFGTYSYVYGSARQLGLPVATALLASASMLLLPQIGWESQRDLTHSVLVTHAAAGSLFLVLRLLNRPSLAGYLALGLLLAVGLLAKYNFALFALALLLAALSLPAGRSRLFDARFVLTLGLAVLLCAPHGLWLAEHWQLASQGSADKMGLVTSGGSLGSLPALLFGLLQFAAPWLLIAGIFWVTRPWPARARPMASQALVERYLLIALALLALVGLALGMDEFKDRWLQPLFFMLPLALLLRLDVEHLAGWRRGGYRVVLAVVALMTLLGMLVQIHLARPLGIETRFTLPMPELVAKLNLPDSAKVLTADAHLGGSLRLARPDLEVFVINEREPVLTQSCYWLWPPKGKSAKRFRRWLKARLGEAQAQARLAAGRPVSVSYGGDQSLAVLVAQETCPAGEPQQP